MRPLALTALLVACGAPPPPTSAPPPRETAVLPAPSAVRTSAPAPVVATPTSSALPNALPRLSASEEDGLTPLDTEVSSAAPVDLFELRLGPGGGAFFPHDREVQMAFVVLEGQVRPDYPDQAAGTLGVWRGAYVPEAGFGLHASGALARVLLIVKSPHGTSVRISADPGQKRFARKSPVHPVAFDTQPPLSWGGGAFHGRIGLDGEGPPPSFALNAIVFGKDAIVQPHAHPGAWECLAILAGDGELSYAPPGKLEKIHLAKGQLACVPEGATHAWTPSGKEPLVALQIYTPPGAEQRWKTLAAPPSP